MNRAYAFPVSGSFDIALSFSAAQAKERDLVRHCSFYNLFRVMHKLHVSGQCKGPLRYIHADVI